MNNFFKKIVKKSLLAFLVFSMLFACSKKNAIQNNNDNANNDGTNDDNNDDMFLNGTDTGYTTTRTTADATTNNDIIPIVNNEVPKKIKDNFKYDKENDNPHY